MAQARLGFTQPPSSSVLKVLPLSATAQTYKRGCVRGNRAPAAALSNVVARCGWSPTQPRSGDGSWRISPISRLRIAAMNPCGTARPHVSRRQAVPLKPNTTTGQPVERRAELMQSFSLIRKSARICVICGYSTVGRPAAASLCLDITFRGGNSTNRDSSQILDIAFHPVSCLWVDIIRIS